MPSYQPNDLPLPRRIVVSNRPLPASLAEKEGVEGSVEVTCADVSREILMDGAAGRLRVGTHEILPTSNAGLEASRQDVITSPGGNVLPEGAVVQYMELAPGAIVPMHRSTSTDYCVFIVGEVLLITPSGPYDVATGKGELMETVCKPGDVVVQRSTLHSWENRTTEWVRFMAFVLGASPTKSEVEGSPEMKLLPDCYYA